MHARSPSTRVLTALLVSLVSAATGLEWVQVVHGGPAHGPAATGVKWAVRGDIDCTLLAEQASELKKASEVIGHVHLDGAKCNEIMEIKLPLLEKITGDFNVTNTASLTRLEVPLLTEVGGLMFNIFENKLLTHILAPALKRLGLTFNWIEKNPSLTKLKLPALDFLGLGLRVDKNRALRSLEVPNAPTTLKVSDNWELTCTVVSNPTDFQWMGNFWLNKVNSPCEESQTCIEISGPTSIKGTYRFKKAYTDNAKDERDMSDGIYVREVQEPWSAGHYVIRRSRYAHGWDFCAARKSAFIAGPGGHFVPPNSCLEHRRHGYIGNNGENNHNRPKTGSLLFANKASLSYCPKVCACRGDEAAPGSRKVLFAQIPSGDGEVGATGRFAQISSGGGEGGGEVGATGRSGTNPSPHPCSCAEP